MELSMSIHRNFTIEFFTITLYNISLNDERTLIDPILELVFTIIFI